MLEEEYKNWLVAVPNNAGLFGCRLCNKFEFKLGNMGKKAVNSHMGSKKHDLAVKHREQIANFFHKHGTPPMSSIASAVLPSTTMPSPSSPSSSSVPVVVEDDVTNAAKSQDSSKNLLQSTITQCDRKSGYEGRNNLDIGNNYERLF